MFKIALRNILRNKRRTFLAGISISAAVMIVIYLWSFVMGIVDRTLDNYFRLNIGHIRILNTDYVKRQKMLPLESNIENYLEVEKIAKKNPEVVLTTGHIKFGVLLEHQDQTKPVVGVGIEPDKEEQVSHLSQFIIAGRKIKPGREEINVGDKLAGELGLKLGDNLTIVTQTAYGSIAAMNLKIVGIFRFSVPSVDGKIFYMPLSKTQELLDLVGRVTEIFVLIKNMDDAPAVAQEIKVNLNKVFPGKLALKPWQDETFLAIWMRLAKYAYGLICFLVLLLASFTILNTMFMAVLERTREIGMMKSLGMRNRQVVGIILLEAMLIGIFASLLGALLGAGIAYYLSVVGIDFTATLGKIKFDVPVNYVYRALFRWSFVLAGFGMGVFFSILAAIPPALRAAKMEAAEALRAV